MNQEILVALKAFYLGRRIASSKSKLVAIDKIKAGIKKLEAISSPEARLREVFYLILLSEIMRNSDNGIEYRSRAREISINNGLAAFDLYMKIVDATQERVHVDRLSGSALSTPNVKNERGYIRSPVFLDQDISWDYAIASLGFDDRSINEADNNFLYHTSLKKIMEKHKIW